MTQKIVAQQENDQKCNSPTLNYVY